MKKAITVVIALMLVGCNNGNDKMIDLSNILKVLVVDYHLYCSYNFKNKKCFNY